MWPFTERRRNKRWNVAWEASLRCKFKHSDQAVRVRVMDVSLGGARLQLDSLRVGPYHLVVGETPTECELVIDAPQGSIRSNVEFRWFNQLDTEDCFTVGAEFVQMEHESRENLRLAIKSL